MLSLKKNSPLTIWAQVIAFSVIVETGRLILKRFALKFVALNHLKFIADFLGDFASKPIPSTAYNRLGLLVITITALFICSFLFNQKKVIKDLLTRKINWNAVLIGSLITGFLVIFKLIMIFKTETIYLLKTLSPHALLALLIYFIIYFINVYAEEIMFRGYIMERFTSLYSIHLACFLQAFIFGAGHLGGFSVLSGLPAFINAFIGGLFFGYLTIYTKSYDSAIGAHLVSNALGNYSNTLADVAHKTYPLKADGMNIPNHYLWGLATIILIYLVHRQTSVTTTTQRS